MPSRESAGRTRTAVPHPCTDSVAAPARPVPTLAHLPPASSGSGAAIQPYARELQTDARSDGS
jgi:hypothetical protein